LILHRIFPILGFQFYWKMKIFNRVFFILFLLIALLQLNDPDPILWIILYVFAAWLSLMASKNQYYPTLHLTQVGLSILWAIYILVWHNGVQEWFDEHTSAELVYRMQADKPWIEETRELGGLLITAMVGGIQWFQGNKKAKN
jgi:hypothetical protein